MVFLPYSTAASVLDTSAATPKTLLSIHNVAKHFGKNIVLRNISLDIAEGEFLTILGESGSGKTTLLRIVAGFESATAGEVWMGDERLDQRPPYRRRVNTVFQHYALFPHLTVEENVGYGLRVAKRPDAEIKTRVEEALAKVKMTAYAKVKPSKISGGQQQRIAYTAVRQRHTSRNSSDTRIYWKLKCEAESRAAHRYRGQSSLPTGRPYSLCDRRILLSFRLPLLLFLAAFACQAG